MKNSSTKNKFARMSEWTPSEDSPKGPSAFGAICISLLTAYCLLPAFSYAQPGAAAKTAAEWVWADEGIYRTQLKKDGIPAAVAEKLIAKRKELIFSGRTISSQPSSLTHVKLFDQNPITQALCSDMGGETGWGGWTARSGTYGPCAPSLFATAPAAPRFNLTSGPGNDVCGTPGPPLPVVAPGFGNASIQIGQPQTNGNLGGCANGCIEEISYPLTVGPNDTNFTFAYAVVIENPASHTNCDQPYVSLCIYDSNGNSIGSCGCFTYTAAPNLPGFYTSSCNVNSSPIYYKPWTLVGINLAPYIGQTLSVVIQNADCSLSGHFAHSYWDFSCGTLSSVYQYCIGEDSLVMVAPSTGAGYTYSWLPVGSTNDSIIVNPQLIDTIILQTIPPSGCGFYSVFILAPTIINTSLSYSVNCNQVTFIDSTTIQGGTISGWNWQFPGGSPASSTSPTPPVVTYPPGTYTASLTVISQAGCTDTTAYTSFTVNPPLPITVNSVAICANITDTLCASSGFSSYLWTPSGQTSSCIIVSSASVPTYTVTGTAANGCTNTAIASVSILPNPSITTSVTAAGCTVLSGTATASVTVITPPYSYVWNTSPPQNTQTATGLASGQYIVQVTNGNGCTSTATVTVPMSGPPTVSAGNAASICPGQTTANISASSVPAGVSYAWSPSAGLSCATCQTTTASPAFTVTYFVTVTDVNGCTNTASVPIVVGALPYVSAIAGYTVCTGGTVPLSANENNILPTSAQWPLQWNWYPPNSPPLNSDTLEDPTITPNTTTNLYVVVTDAFGCKDTAYATVYVETIPSVSLTDWTPYITCEGYVIPFLADVSANGGSAYWDFGDNSNFTDYQPVPPPIDPWPSTPTPHIYNFGGTYTVSVVAINSICRDTIDTTFTVNDQGKYLNILPANVFTPNGDMYNECFRPALDITNVPNITNPDSLKATLVQCIELEVWDRWGIKLFESTETVKCWNGKTKQGTPAKAGTYYYIARFKDVIINGFVELLR